MSVALYATNQFWHHYHIKSVIFTPACRNLVNSNQVAGIKFDAHCFVRGLNSIIGYLGFPEPRQARRWNSVPRLNRE